MSGCLGIGSININGGCSSSVLIKEISYDGGVMFGNAGEGPWYFASSLQPDGELKFKATIRKLGCEDQYITASFFPDEECFIGSFEMEWDVTGGDTIPIATDPLLTYDYNVDWGDGNIESNITGDANHTYLDTGIYTVKVLGTFPRIYYNTTPSPIKQKLIKIKKWGNIQWESFVGAFIGCSNLEVTATDSPNLSNVTELKSMFYGCSSLTNIPSINSWDLSNIIDVTAMFYSSEFDGNLGNWNTSNIENFEYTFGNCPFNNSGSDSIKNWDITNVKKFGYMFVNNTTFNQPLTNWDTSLAEEFLYMFYGASNFNQPLNNFNISSIITGSISSPSVALAGMFDMSGLTTSSYNAILNNFASTALDKNLRYVEMGAVGINYSSLGSGSRETLTNTLGWTVTDAGII